MVFDPDAASPIPSLVKQHLDGASAELLVASQTMARQLYSSQTRQNSAGLLIVSSVVVSSGPGLAILKLEHEDGIRVRRNSDESHLALDIEYISELVMTSQTKVFKAGLFYPSADDGGASGLVSDQQRSDSRRGDVAAFFLRARGNR